MALTIEDGTGVTGADSFITADECADLEDAYFGEHLHGSAEHVDAEIRRAWVYMKSLAWREDYPWPTLGGAIPDDVKLAQSILARAEHGTINALQPTVTPGAQKVLNRVGDIGWQVMAQSGVDAQRAVVTMAMDLLAPYISATGATKLLARA